MTQLDLTNGVVSADPMNRFYEDLPNHELLPKLESNRPQSEEPVRKDVQEETLEQQEQQDGSEGGEADAQDNDDEAGQLSRPLFAQMSDDEDAELEASSFQVASENT